jgi:hypothetical protein
MFYYKILNIFIDLEIRKENISFVVLKKIKEKIIL